MLPLPTLLTCRYGRAATMRSASAHPNNIAGTYGKCSRTAILFTLLRVRSSQDRSKNDPKTMIFVAKSGIQFKRQLGLNLAAFCEGFAVQVYMSKAKKKIDLNMSNVYDDF